MNKEELNNDYFLWLCSFTSDKHKISTHSKLLNYLHNVSFVYIFDMDGNRAEDGVDLRYTFGRELEIPDYIVTSMLDYRDCTMLEMLVALSIRCEKHIMDDIDIGDRTPQWFWIMMDNLGVSKMNDKNFNRTKLSKNLDIFLNRKFKPNGEGGLFITDNERLDMRNIDIWYQLCVYLDENFM